jgi:hypothetical protein
LCAHTISYTVQAHKKTHSVAKGQAIGQAGFRP